MTFAELMQKNATDAANEGGIWLSGEYMGMLAGKAQSIESENVLLRELARATLLCSEGDVRCDACSLRDKSVDGPAIVCRSRTVARELGIEVDG